MAGRGSYIKSSRRDEAAAGARRLTITRIHENGILLRAVIRGRSRTKRSSRRGANIKIMHRVMMSRHACIRAVNRAFIGLPQQYRGKLFDQRWVYGSHLDCRKMAAQHMARKLVLIRPIKKSVCVKCSQRICFPFCSCTARVLYKTEAKQMKFLAKFDLPQISILSRSLLAFTRDY